MVTSHLILTVLNDDMDNSVGLLSASPANSLSLNPNGGLIRVTPMRGEEVMTS